MRTRQSNAAHMCVLLQPSTRTHLSSSRASPASCACPVAPPAAPPPPAAGPPATAAGTQLRPCSSIEKQGMQDQVCIALPCTATQQRQASHGTFHSAGAALTCCSPPWPQGSRRTCRPCGRGARCRTRCRPSPLSGCRHLTAGRRPTHLRTAGLRGGMAVARRGEEWVGGGGGGVDARSTHTRAIVEWGGGRAPEGHT